MTNLGGASTLASPLLSPDQRTTMVVVAHVLQVCTKLYPQPIVAMHAPLVIIPINALQLLVLRAPKDSILIVPEEAFVRLVLRDVLMINLHKRLHHPVKAAMQENTHPHPTLPLALIAHRAQTTKILKAPFPNTTNVPIVKIVPLASIPNFTLIPRNVSSVHRPKSPVQLIAVGAVQAHTSTSLKTILTEEQHPHVVYALEDTTRTIVILMSAIFVQRVTMVLTRDRF